MKSYKSNCSVYEIFFSNYGGGGSRDFQIYSKIGLEDQWDFCLNGNLSKILSKSDEVTRYFPLAQQKSIRFVQIRTESAHKASDGILRGGLQYFSENTLGTPGASYQGKQRNPEYVFIIIPVLSFSVSSQSRDFSKFQLLLASPDVHSPRISDFPK